MQALQKGKKRTMIFIQVPYLMLDSSSGFWVLLNVLKAAT
jgi:hypothetical protein